MIAHVFEDLCNGCGTCVSACPTHVFDIGEAGVPVIARVDQCQTCFMCELYCDQDALFVGPDQRQPEDVDPDVIRRSGFLGQMRRDHGWSVDTPLEHRDQYWRLGVLLREGAETAARRYDGRQRRRASANNGVV